MARKRKLTDRPIKKKDTGYGMTQLRLGMSSIKKNCHFGETNVGYFKNARIKKNSNGRAFIDDPNNQKVVWILDVAEVEKNHKL